MPPTDSGPDFGAVDRRLRQILKPLRSRLVATKDSPEGLALEIPGLEGKPWGYAFPDLRDELSPELRRRMQGKSCFNFTTVDEALFDELARVTQAGFQRYLALATEVAKEKARETAR